MLDANTQENLPTLIKMGFVGTIFVLDPSQHQTHFFYSNKEEPMTTLQIENVVFGFVFDFESPIFLNLILHLVVIHIFWAPNDCSTEYVHCAFKEKNAFSCTLNLNVNVSTPMATDFFLACSKSQGQSISYHSCQSTAISFSPGFTFNGLFMSHVQYSGIQQCTSRISSSFSFFNFIFVYI